MHAKVHEELSQQTLSICIYFASTVCASDVELFQRAAATWDSKAAPLP